MPGTGNVLTCSQVPLVRQGCFPRTCDDVSADESFVLIISIYFISFRDRGLQCYYDDVHTHSFVLWRTIPVSAPLVSTAPTSRQSTGRLARNRGRKPVPPPCWEVGDPKFRRRVAEKIHALPVMRFWATLQLGVALRPGVSWGSRLSPSVMRSSGIRQLSTCTTNGYLHRRLDGTLGRSTRRTQAVFQRRCLSSTIASFTNTPGRDNIEDLQKLQSSAQDALLRLKPNEALDSLQAALALAPSDEFLLSELGFLHLYTKPGGEEEAAAYLQRALELNPTSSLRLTLLETAIALKQGQMPRTRNCFEKARNEFAHEEMQSTLAVYGAVESYLALDLQTHAKEAYQLSKYHSVLMNHPGTRIEPLVVPALRFGAELEKASPDIELIIRLFSEVSLFTMWEGPQMQQVGLSPVFETKLAIAGHSRPSAENMMGPESFEGLLWFLFGTVVGFVSLT